jgi:hypothetical protein
VREEQIERDPKALVDYLNNVDVGQPYGELNHGINPVSLCSYFLYICLHYLKLFLAKSLCFRFDLFGVLVLCAGTPLTLLETPMEVLHQVWFVLELVEGLYLDCWFVA